MTNTTLASSFTNFVTIAIGIAFLGVATVGIVSPVQAQPAVATTAAR